MNFLFDNALPPKLAKALNILVQPDHEVRHLKEQFAASVDDQDWIKGLAGDDDWIIVTADTRSERNAHESQAWQQMKRPVITLKSGWLDLPFWRQMNILTKSFPNIISALHRLGTDQPLALTTSVKVGRRSKR